MLNPVSLAFPVVSGKVHRPYELEQCTKSRLAIYVLRRGKSHPDKEIRPCFGNKNRPQML